MQRKRLYDGKTAEEWLALYGNRVPLKTFRNRMEKGDWTPERAASLTRYAGIRHQYMIDGIPAKKWLKENNPDVSYNTFVSRVHNGFSVDDAARTPILTNTGRPRTSRHMSDENKKTLDLIGSLKRGERLVWHHKRPKESMCNPLAPYIADMAAKGLIHCFQRVISTNAAGEQEIDYIAEGR